jgi:hypothetical protein
MRETDDTIRRLLEEEDDDDDDDDEVNSFFPSIINCYLTSRRQELRKKKE